MVDTTSIWKVPEDSLWEEVQKKTFCGWVNMHLEKKQMRIQDLEIDLSDGVKLIALLEVLNNGPIEGRFYKNPKSKPYKIDNINFALNFITDTFEVKLIGCSAADIVDGNLKIILGMLWRLIQRFQLSKDNSRAWLLNWCKETLGKYDKVSIQNFQSSFRDGLAFCALIHNYDNSFLDFESLNPDHRTNNLQLAFQKAEEYLEIPQLLDPSDISVGLTDERSIMTYLSLVKNAYDKRGPSTPSQTSFNFSTPSSSSNAQDKALQDEKDLQIQQEMQSLLLKKKELEEILKSMNDQVQKLSSENQTFKEENTRLRAQLENESDSEEDSPPPSPREKPQPPVSAEPKPQEEQPKHFEIEKPKEESKPAQQTEQPKDAESEKPREQPTEVDSPQEKQPVEGEAKPTVEPAEQPQETAKKEEEKPETPKEEQKVAEQTKQVEEPKQQEEIAEVAEKPQDEQPEQKVESGRATLSTSTDEIVAPEAGTRDLKAEPIVQSETKDEKQIEEVKKTEDAPQKDVEPDEERKSQRNKIKKQARVIGDLQRVNSELVLEIEETRQKLHKQVKVSETLQKSLEDTREEISMLQKQQKKTHERALKKLQKRSTKRIQRRDKEIETLKSSHLVEIQQKMVEISTLRHQLKKIQEALGGTSMAPRSAVIEADIQALRSERDELYCMVKLFEEEEEAMIKRARELDDDEDEYRF